MAVSTKRKNVSKSKSKTLSKSNKGSSSKKSLIKSRKSGNKTRKMRGGREDPLSAEYTLTHRLGQLINSKRKKEIEKTEIPPMKNAYLRGLEGFIKAKERKQYEQKPSTNYKIKSHYNYIKH